VPAKGQAKARALAEVGDERFADIGGVMHVLTADGPRYRMLGNSMAVPVMAWLGRRIAMVEAIQ
jgi:site-specific DNA-cytosine methylase